VPTEWLDDYKGIADTVEVNVTLSLCLIGHHTLKMYGGVQVQLHRFLTSSVEGEWFTACLNCFVLGDRADWVPKQKTESPCCESLDGWERIWKEAVI
jgi:hypothetical protein